MNIRDVSSAKTSSTSLGVTSVPRRAIRFGVGSGFALSAFFALVSACGSSSGGGNGSASGGAPVSASGGALSSGGSTSGGPGQGGAASKGGAPSAGAAGASTAGAAGAGGIPGGDFFNCPTEKPTVGATCMRLNPTACTYADGGCLCSGGMWDCYSSADCPATAPADAATCTLANMACSYGDLSCTCNTMSGWSCVKPCPAAQPTAQETCQRPALSTCRYAAGALVNGPMMSDATCACSDGTFKCFTQSDCPTASPTTGAACDFPTLGCTYSTGQCSCGADGTWTCSMSCPSMQPTAGAACDRISGGGSCRYTAGALVMGGGTPDATCSCQDQKFSCITQADCPATAPATQAACTGLTGLSCTYSDRQCSCGPNGWSCTTNCPAQPPTNGTACERRNSCQYAAGALVSMGTTADTTCACANNAFQCYTAADCPATQPMSATACTQPGISCPFAGQTCRCSTSSGMWGCNPTPGGGGGAGGMGGTARGGASNAGGTNGGGASSGGTTSSGGASSSAGASNGGASSGAGTAGVSGSN